MKRLPKDRRARSGGFTLLEMVVVVGLILLVSGAVSLALLPGRAGRAGAAGRQLVAAALAATRSQAALTGGEACLLIDADPTSAGFLRCLRIAQSETSPAGEWTWAGDRLCLPGPIFVVPGEEVAGTAAGVADGWPAALRSTVLQALPSAPAGYLSIARFAASGGSLAPAGRLVLAPARLAGGRLHFDQPAAATNLVVSRYGAVSTGEGRR